MLRSFQNCIQFCAFEQEINYDDYAKSIKHLLDIFCNHYPKSVHTKQISRELKESDLETLDKHKILKAISILKQFDYIKKEKEKIYTFTPEKARHCFEHTKTKVLSKLTDLIHKLEERALYIIQDIETNQLLYVEKYQPFSDIDQDKYLRLDTTSEMEILSSLKKELELFKKIEFENSLQKASKTSVIQAPPPQKKKPIQNNIKQHLLSMSIQCVFQQLEDK